MGLAKVTLIGNLGQDPELKYTPQSNAVCNFSVAVNSREKEGEEWVDKTTWYRITLWNKMAENASKYLEKGSQVYIEGRLRLSEWTDRDGALRNTLEVTGTEMQFIGSRNDNVGDAYEKPQESKPSNKVETPADDDIPF